MQDIYATNKKTMHENKRMGNEHRIKSNIEIKESDIS